MEIESITASAACAGDMVPDDARASTVGSVPISVEGKSAKASFMVTYVEASPLQQRS